MNKTTLMLLAMLLGGAIVFFWGWSDDRNLKSASASAVESSSPAGIKSAVPSRRAGALQPRSQAENTNVAAADFSGFLQRILTNEHAEQLRPEQLENYLLANRRSVESLLAAYRTTGARKFLQEAQEKFPQDPQVLLEVYARTLPAEGESLDPQQRAWVDSLKAADPDNAIGNYLSAREYFDAGEVEKAAAEMVAAEQKGTFNDYAQNFLQSTEEALRAAGHSEAEAKLMSQNDLALPQVSAYKQLGVNFVEAAQARRQAGDDAGADALLNHALGLSRRLQNAGPHSLIHDLVAMSVERRVLQTLDPAMPYEGGGLTVQDRMDQLTRQREEIKILCQVERRLMPTLTETQWVEYSDRNKVLGSQAALRWLVKKYGEK